MFVEYFFKWLENSVMEIPVEIGSLSEYTTCVTTCTLAQDAPTHSASSFSLSLFLCGYEAARTRVCGNNVKNVQGGRQFCIFFVCGFLALLGPNPILTLPMLQCSLLALSAECASWWDAGSTGGKVCAFTTLPSYPCHSSSQQGRWEDWRGCEMEQVRSRNGADSVAMVATESYTPSQVRSHGLK